MTCVCSNPEKNLVFFKIEKQLLKIKFFLFFNNFETKVMVLSKGLIKFLFKKITFETLFFSEINQGLNKKKKFFFLNFNMG
mmetsp:Transcript_61398/g.147783  ORF Transcript_61398/g.147783 Transcript_61398/m.147783 type:complete len:81 (-) Transcript_61398:195-437(-)